VISWIVPVAADKTIHEITRTNTNHNLRFDLDVTFEAKPIVVLVEVS